MASPILVTSSVGQLSTSGPRTHFTMLSAKLKRTIDKAKLKRTIDKAKLKHTIDKAKLKHTIDKAKLKHTIDKAKLKHRIEYESKFFFCCFYNTEKYDWQVGKTTHFK
jgi:hypothetical protein